MIRELRGRSVSNMPDPVKRLFRSVEMRHGLTRQAIRSERRFAELVTARVEIADGLRLMGYSLNTIGWFMGRHHTSVMHYLMLANRRKHAEQALGAADESGIWAI